ncbi:hypothetical protein NDU88_002845 [Pleurodeles waltl]|uniref:Uncharacterized protein n=1 Tax=Pleurodeles waltl TaxID=8319 RepID=A0AAV7LLA8_PLEWA|nr:hypothetical protein NDU88_002845 [Pleurodeles waltl]
MLYQLDEGRARLLAPPGQRRTAARAAAPTTACKLSLFARLRAAGRRYQALRCLRPWQPGLSGTSAARLSEPAPAAHLNPAGRGPLWTQPDTAPCRPREPVPEIAGIRGAAALQRACHMGATGLKAPVCHRISRAGCGALSARVCHYCRLGQAPEWTPSHC